MSKWPSSRTGFVLSRSGEIDLHAVGEVVGVVDARAAADGFEASGEERAHAVGGGLVVAGRFDLDELADGLDDLLLARFEVAQAFGPDRVGLETAGGCFGVAVFLATSIPLFADVRWLRAFVNSCFSRFRSLDRRVAERPQIAERCRFWSCSATLPDRALAGQAVQYNLQAVLRRTV